VSLLQVAGTQLGAVHNHAKNVKVVGWQEGGDGAGEFRLKFSTVIKPDEFVVWRIETQNFAHSESLKAEGQNWTMAFPDVPSSTVSFPQLISGIPELQDLNVKITGKTFEIKLNNEELRLTIEEQLRAAKKEYHREVEERARKREATNGAE